MEQTVLMELMDQPVQWGHKVQPEQMEQTVLTALMEQPVQWVHKVQQD
jgi:hypothetical protein